MFRIGCCLLGLICCSLSYALILENSASANALNGCPLLSQSVCDYALSPVNGSYGLGSSYSSPFSIPGLHVFGLHTAFPSRWLGYALGTSYLSAEDYDLQSYYLNLHLKLGDILIGSNQHLEFEIISNDDTHIETKTDFGIRLGGRFPSEISLLGLGSQDRIYSFSFGSHISKRSFTAVTYRTDWDKDFIYCIASQYNITDGFRIMSSYQDEPTRFGAGIELSVLNLRVLYAIRTHIELNLTHAIDLSFDW